MSLSDEQIEDSVVLERSQVLKEYSLKGILPLKDLYLSINCIDVDCKSLDRCTCNSGIDECSSTPVAHFEIPQLLNDYGSQSIDYIGSTDRTLPFVVYTSSKAFTNHKYRKRGKNRPVVWIDTTPNENGMYDCFVFNAPLLAQVSVTAIFKDTRQLQKYACCTENADDNFSFIDNDVIRRLTEKYLRYFRSTAPNNLPNDQQYTQG